MKKIKFYTGILILTIVAVIVISGCTKETTSTTQTKENALTDPVKASEFLTYESSAYNIEIEYPSDWIKKEQVMGTVAVFLSPMESDSDIFQENLNIIIQDLSAQPMTLEEYTNLSVGQVEQYITDANLLDSAAATLDGNPAHKMVYTGKQGQYNFKWMQVWTIKDDTAYVLSYTAEVDKYSDFLDAAQEMVNSFEID